MAKTKLTARQKKWLKYLNNYDVIMWNNGCGPQWLIKKIPNKLKSIMQTIFNMMFAYACARHDCLYSIGGTEKERKYADQLFYKDLKKMLKSAKKPWYNCVVLQI